MWANYDPIWLDFTIKKVSFSAYFWCQILSKSVAQEEGTKTHNFETKIEIHGLHSRRD